MPPSNRRSDERPDLPPEPGRTPTGADKVSVEFGVPLDTVTRAQATAGVSVGVGVGELETTVFGGSVDVQHEAIATDVRKLFIKYRHRGIVTVNSPPWMV